jgi:SAM-dependent methyltransferase
MQERKTARVRRSTPLIIAFKIYQNWRIRKRLASGNIETSHGSAHRSRDLEGSLSYIDEHFNDYLNYSRLTAAQLRGRRVLELGFGDNVGVALRFLAAGVSRVVCLDKFYSERDVMRERSIYAALRERLNDDEEKKRFDEAISLTDGVKLNKNRLRCINGYDLDIAAKTLFKEDGIFDVIVSRAVIEEIYEPDNVLAAADKLLAPEGIMLHRIDFSDYGIFTSAGMHPLTFLTIPEFLYRLMASHSGIPNRRLIGYYRRKMNELGYRTTFLITKLVGHGPVIPHKEFKELDEAVLSSPRSSVNEIRPKLGHRFKNLSDEELMVSGVFLVATKQGAD